MAWTTPSTAVAGQTLSAAFWNEQVRDNTQHLYDTMGLVLITSASFSSVASVSVNDCFTSAYENYKVFFSGMRASTSAPRLRIRFRASGTDATGTNYESATADIGANVYLGNRTASETSCACGFVPSAGLGGAGFEFTIFQPALAQRTVAFEDAVYPVIASTSRSANAHMHDVGTAYDGFTFFLTGANVTGRYNVYGIRSA